jgi:hypothetical protein
MCRVLQQKDLFKNFDRPFRRLSIVRKRTIFRVVLDYQKTTDKVFTQKKLQKFIFAAFLVRKLKHSVHFSHAKA